MCYNSRGHLTWVVGSLPADMGYFKAIGIEVQRNCRTVNILDLHLQTKEYSETHNLATRRQFPSQNNNTNN